MTQSVGLQTSPKERTGGRPLAVGLGVVVAAVSFLVLSIGQLVWWNNIVPGVVLILVGAALAGAAILKGGAMLESAMTTFLSLLVIAVILATIVSATYPLITFDNWDQTTVLRVGASGPANIAVAAILIVSWIGKRLVSKKHGSSQSWV